MIDCVRLPRSDTPKFVYYVCDVASGFRRRILRELILRLLAADSDIPSLIGREFSEMLPQEGGIGLADEFGRLELWSRIHPLAE